MATIEIQLAQNSPTSVQLQHQDFPIIIDRPVEKGGHGHGLMGGQYLLTGIAGCFCSTLFAAAQSREITIEGLQVNVTATLSEELPKRFTKVQLDVSYKNTSHPDEFDKLLVIAEKGCISVNTVKNGLNFNVSHQN